MKPSITKYTHRTNKHTTRGVFSALKERFLTGKIPEFKDSYTNKVHEVIEAHLAPLNPGFVCQGGAENLYGKQAACLDQLKHFALLGVPTAIRFYHEALESCDYFNWLDNHIDGNKLCEQLITDAKEVALCIKDPLLLMSIYERRTYGGATHYVNPNDANFCLKAAAEMEDIFSSRAAHTLALIYVTTVLHAKGINYLSVIPDADSILYRPNKSRLHVIMDAEQLYTTYFNLALEKAKGAPATVFSNLPYDLHQLIQLKILIEETEENFKGHAAHYQHYYDLIKQSADVGEIGAMYTLIHLETKQPSPNQEIIKSLLNKLVSLPVPNHPVIAKAANDLYRMHEEEPKKQAFRLGNSYYVGMFAHQEQAAPLQRQAVRLGDSYHTCVLAYQDFERNNLPEAMAHFEQISLQAHLLAPYDFFIYKAHILPLITRGIHDNKIALDTDQKIDFYFKICADLLMDLENVNRFYYCKYISSILMFLFPDKETQPDIVKNWLTIDTSNLSLQRKEKYFPLLTRNDIQATMLAFANAAKQRILENKPLDAALAMIDHIKKNPSSQEEAAQQLITAFLLPWNTHLNVPLNNEELREKQLESLLQLKTLALSGILTAVKFYREFFCINDDDSIGFGYDISCECLHKKSTSKHLCFPSELISHAREIAFQIKDPYLLMRLYIFKKEFSLLPDIEDAFFCLQEAAKMEDAEAAKAAYCLADYYGSEVSENINSHFSDIVKDVISNTINQTISEEQAIKSLHALEKMGSILAANISLHINRTQAESENRTITAIFSQYQAFEEFSTLTSSQQEAFVRRQFSTYFNVAINKSMDVGLVKVLSPFTPNKKTSCLNFKTLINWNMEINHPDHDMHYYCDQFKQQAESGNMGTKLAYAHFFTRIELDLPSIPMEKFQTTFPTLLSICELLQEIINASSLTNNNRYSYITAEAAESLAAYVANEDIGELDYLDQKQEQAAKLGDKCTASDLALRKFNKHPQEAMAYLSNTDLHNPLSASTEKYMFFEKISKGKKIRTINTVEKIECYFTICRDILMDMTTPYRFICCDHLTKVLLHLFPNERNRPALIKEWFLFNPYDGTPSRNKYYFPLNTQSNIRETLIALTDAAKQALLNQQQAMPQLFFSPSSPPLSSPASSPSPSPSPSP